MMMTMTVGWGCDRSQVPRMNRCLWLSSNHIEDLPTDKTVMLLEYDPLTGERKSLYSAGIRGLTSLQELWIESNHLEELPPDIGELQSLRYCNLRRNLISQIPAEFSKLAKLEILVLTHNQFSQVMVVVMMAATLKFCHPLSRTCLPVANPAQLKP